MTQPTSENPPKKQARKKVKFERGAFYKVTWLDILAYSGWVAVSGDKRVPAECITYGWATDIGAKSVRLSATTGDNKDGSEVEYNQHISIPVGCVQSAERITAP